LHEIQSPECLKKMNVKQLEAMSADIRKFLIETLSETGGHIAPNLGVVELTLAMHKVFDSPKDKFIWDVGHQSYVHKILTGRTKDFPTLRQYKGLCGFPKRSESEHDVWETGHSSTSLSAAMGMALARDIQGGNNHVVPVIGDGSLTGGMALEALNHIGHERTKVIVILNDNEMSIAPNVGALHHMLGNIRSGKGYKRTKEEIEHLLKKIPAVGDSLALTAEKMKDSFKYLFVKGVFFEELGFTYYGPIDGHNFHELIPQLELAKRAEGPVLLHIVTKKGKGYLPAETDAVGTWHGTGPYKIESGDFVKPAKKLPAWSAVISDAFLELAEQDPKVVAVTPAMPVGSKLEKFQKNYPGRMFDVGIAEQHAVTMAGALAIEGMRPFLAIYSTFLQRGYDQVVHDVARQKLPVIFGIDRAGLVGADGETHQGVYDISFLRHIPNMTIAMPKDENEARHLAYTAYKYTDGPFALRYPRGNAYGIPLDKEMREITIGTWETIMPGADAAVLTFGPTLDLAYAARETLRKSGVSLEVVNARFIKPLDESYLHRLFRSGVPIVTMEEAALQGGFGSFVLEWANEHGYNTSQVVRMGIPDMFIEHGNPDELLEEIGFTTEALVEQVQALVGKQGVGVTNNVKNF
ncbi:MAG: 1-deoxy-D-xylulose-5-phosphate synthase, partial [Bacilli bacterium]